MAEQATDREPTEQEAEDAFRQMDAVVRSGETRLLYGMMSDAQIIGLAQDWNEEATLAEADEAAHAR